MSRKKISKYLLTIHVLTQCPLSEFMKKDDKRYFLDLKENSRGRFLRVSQVVRYTRQHVAFPAILLIELRNAINEVSVDQSHKAFNHVASSQPITHRHFIT